MWFFNQTSSAARIATAYITAGALIVVWTTVWYVYLHNNPPESGIFYYLCSGLFITGLTLAFIGLGLGKIGRVSKSADAPPPAIPVATANPQTNGTAPAAHAIVAAQGTAPVQQPVEVLQ